MNPSVIDLAYWYENGERRMMCICVLDDGEFWHSPAYPSNGALSAIAQNIRSKFGESTQDQDLDLLLTSIHYQNMARKQNSVGQDYPSKFPLQAIADGIKKLTDEGIVKPLPDGSQLQEVVPGLVWLVTESDKTN